MSAQPSASAWLRRRQARRGFVWVIAACLRDSARALGLGWCAAGAPYAIRILSFDPDSASTVPVGCACRAPAIAGDALADPKPRAIDPRLSTKSGAGGSRGLLRRWRSSLAWFGTECGGAAIWSGAGRSGTAAAVTPTPTSIAGFAPCHTAPAATATRPVASRGSPAAGCPCCPKRQLAPTRIREAPKTRPALGGPCRHQRA